MPKARTSALPVLLALALLALVPRALAKKPAAKAGPGGARIELAGSVAVGLDKTFIKDASGRYFLIRGADLSRFAGRRIRATGQVLGQEQDYQVVRLLDYRILSPDDDSPGATSGAGGRPRK